MRTTKTIQIPNKQNEIDRFWAKVYINGRLIDQRGEYALMEYKGRTYEIKKTERGEISKMDAELWYATKDDISVPEAGSNVEIPSDEELDGMIAELEAM